jgi:hypothetical protein
MPKIFAVPKEGVLVRHANGKPLDTAGEAVERDSYWLRRERDGDVTLGEVPAETPADVVEAASAAPTKKAK